jgi:hypothetical protein
MVEFEIPSKLQTISKVPNVESDLKLIIKSLRYSHFSFPEAILLLVGLFSPDFQWNFIHPCLCAVTTHPALDLLISSPAYVPWLV